MADAPEPDYSTGPSNPTIPPRLRYPTFPPISRSVEEWLSQSRPAEMAANSFQPERPSSSLSESWATLSTSDMHSEDGTRSEQTDIGSLIDQNGPDDVASLDERESNSYGEDNEEEDEQSSILESQELPQPLFARDDTAVGDSNLTMKAALHQSLESIEFPEPDKWPEVERVELKHTIHILDEDEASDLKTRLPLRFDHSHLAITVQQTMTKQSLDLDKPFHVLYVGNPDFRNIVLDKIGDVLVSSSTDSLGTSSTESSRYHVVPTSFGAGATPNYAELLPIHVQLIVDECVEATWELQAFKPSTVTLKFKNRPPCTSAWTGSQYHITSSTGWNLPDVAIIFVSDQDSDLTVRTRSLAHTFMERHGIPVMVISEEPLWKKAATELIPLDYQSLHICLESRRPLTGETVVLRRYPIDLKTFESIAPGQLNRHLASLSGLYQKTTSSVTVQREPLAPPETKPFHDSEKYPKSTIFSAYTERAQELTPILRLVTLAIVFAVAISLGYTAIKALAALFIQIFARSALSGLASTTPTAVVPSTEFLGHTSFPLKTSSVSEHRPLSHKTEAYSTAGELMDISHILMEPPAEADVFQVQVVGDCHVIIKPPSTKKQPKFNVSVSRSEQTLPYELSKLFDGVYTLRLNREDAYGLLNVTITVNSKPAVEQTLEVDFGTPWLKIENWKKAAQAVSSQILKDFSTAQTGLSEIYGRLSTDLQIWMGDVVRKSHALRREAGSFSRNSLKRTRGTTDVVLSRSMELTEFIKRTAQQQFTAASAALQEHSGIFQGTREFVSNALNTISAHTVDLESFKDRLHRMKTSECLARAQKTAQQLTKQKLGQQSRKLDHPRHKARRHR
ncbi:hypothetical protein VTN77DRAFT_3748 [Rasamsonia byssochlamydoides]|uniref:uncharacterized protein n=1 Tax=Rasamsonia byssochlamydoides TaxID=89139 RepID=UPI0037449388